MRHHWVLAVVFCLSAGMLWADQEPSKTEGAATPPKPVDGMLCVGEKSVESPAILDPALADKLEAQRVAIPDCPVNFSDCVDVPGRKCTLQNCVTVDLGHHCRQPNGQILNCAGGTSLIQTTCSCLERLHLICCDDGSCSFGDCGICSGGSLTTACQ